MGTYKDLYVYQESFQAAIGIYRMSLSLPQYLQYDIADDIRRAARSVPSNLAEGYGRGKSLKDTVNFLKTSLGSNDEVLFNLEFLFKLKLIDEEKYEKAISTYTKIGVGIRKLIEQMQKTQST